MEVVGEWRTVSGSGEMNAVTALPRVHRPRDLVKEGDHATSWGSTAKNHPLAIKVTRTHPWVVGIAQRRSLTCPSDDKQFIFEDVRRQSLDCFSGHSSLALADDVDYCIVAKRFKGHSF